jgi:hypothetical protein
MKQCYLTMEMSLMKTLWQQVIKIMRLEAEITLGLDHNMLGILVVPIPPMERSQRIDDLRGTPCEQELLTDKSFTSSSWT